jgi:hypothetical protein
MAVQPVATGLIVPVLGPNAAPRGTADVAAAALDRTVQDQVQETTLDAAADRAATTLTGINATPVYDVNARVNPIGEHGRGRFINARA